jgi:hypothetical protein
MYEADHYRIGGDGVYDEDTLGTSKLDYVFGNRQHVNADYAGAPGAPASPTTTRCGAGSPCTTSHRPARGSPSRAGLLTTPTSGWDDQFRKGCFPPLRGRGERR